MLDETYDYGVVYRLISPSGKSYVGQTTDFRRRIAVYRKGGKPGQRKLYAALQKYGFDKFKIEILCRCCSAEDLSAREIHCISIFDSYRTGYNGNAGGYGAKHSEETLLRMANAARGKVMLQSTREKISKAQKGRPSNNKGKKLKQPHEYVKRKRAATKDPAVARQERAARSRECLNRPEVKEKFKAPRAALISATHTVTAQSLTLGRRAWGTSYGVDYRRLLRGGVSKGWKLNTSNL